MYINLYIIGESISSLWHVYQKRKKKSEHSWIKVFHSFHATDITESTLSLFTQVCDMCMRSCAYWCTSCCGHCVQDVQTPSLSDHPVATASELLVLQKGCRGFKWAEPVLQCLISSRQISTVQRKKEKNQKEIKKAFLSTGSHRLTPERTRGREGREKGEKIIDKACSISDLSLRLFDFVCLSGHSLALMLFQLSKEPN